MNGWPTDFLFAEPGFASGAASVLDLAGLFNQYNQSRDGTEADEKALLNDWYNVGQDLIEAISSHVKEEE